MIQNGVRRPADGGRVQIMARFHCPARPAFLTMVILFQTHEKKQAALFVGQGGRSLKKARNEMITLFSSHKLSLTVSQFRYFVLRQSNAATLHGATFTSCHCH
jgi:hypothetical protein